jgi:hypothetical protein
MPNVSIDPKNHTNCDGDDFVGMKFVSKDDGKSSSVKAIFPLGYHCFDKKNQDELKKELYALLCTIRRHSENKDDNLDRTKANTEKNKFPFDAYIAVIRDFMQYGYYIESEIKYKRSPLGKINWKRTIAQVRPIIQDDGSPIYTDFVIKQTAKKTDNLISLIHEWCVYEAFKTFGWLFTTFNPHESTLKIGDDNKNYFISVIHDSLKSTFNDRNRTLFRAMITMLRYGGVGEKEPFFYGTTHFHTVWEGLIDMSYGIPEDEKKNFFPEAEWIFIDGASKRNHIYPDTIMRLDDGCGEIFVLDAKYYSFIEDKRRVPAASDIHKQVAYGKYAMDEITPKPSQVYNAFLIPYDFESDRHKLGTKNKEYYCIGYARLVGGGISKEEESYKYKRVLGILIDTKRLMQDAGTINKNSLAVFIRQSYEQLCVIKA